MEGLVVIEMVILTHSSNFQNYIKKTNKIPEYAREYKKEYLLIIGINKEFKYFVENIDDATRGLFENHKVVRIKYFIKRFLKGQERGKLQDISSFVLWNYDISFIEDLYLIIIYEIDFEEVDKSDYRDFYELFCKFYEKIKIVYYDDDDEYVYSDSEYSDSEDSEDSDIE